MTPHTTTHWCLVLRQKRHIDTLCYDTMTPHTITSWHLILRNHATSYCNTLTPRTATETTSCYDTMTPHTMYDTITHETILTASNLHVSSFFGSFWPSWTDFMCLWRWVFRGHENFWPSFMDRFYVCRKVWLPCCFVFTMWAWELFAFMDWFNGCLKASSWVALHSQCEHGNFWPSWTDFMCALRCPFCADL